MKKLIRKDIKSKEDMFKALNRNEILVISLLYFLSLVLSPLMVIKGTGVIPYIGITTFLAGAISIIIISFRILIKR